MFTTLFLNTVYAFLNIMLTPIMFFGDVSLPADIENGLSQAFEAISAFDFVFPVGTLVSVVVIILTFEGFYLLFRGFNWVLRRLPTQS